MTEGENEQRFADRALYRAAAGAADRALHRDDSRLWRVCEMWWPQGEDDGSVLRYVTEDEPQRAPQITHYTETTPLM